MSQVVGLSIETGAGCNGGSTTVFEGSPCSANRTTHSRRPTLNANGGNHLTSFLVADRAPLVYALPNLIKPYRSYKAQKSVYSHMCTIANPQSSAYARAQIASCQLAEVGKRITRHYLFTDLCQTVMSDLGLFACCCSSASQVASYRSFSASFAIPW